MPLTPIVSDNDHSWGEPGAPLVLVEYGDFQCPHCGRAYPLVKQIKQELNGLVKVVFRNFPLTKIHPQAKAAAVASESAALQQQFWAMHDLLFENQKRLNNQALLEYAAQLNLDIDRFTADLSDEGLHKKVEGQFMGGLRSGVNATPTFFVNGQHYTGSWEEGGLLTYLKEQAETIDSNRANTKTDNQGR